mmetsp:Transcript_11641/g.36155  ORF Transcript_11641/g.36155 Transcript_11641/m.36155 type:complete len:489 (+) Transcript_11641:629-2095(+)
MLPSTHATAAAPTAGVGRAAAGAALVALVVVVAVLTAVAAAAAAVAVAIAVSIAVLAAVATAAAAVTVAIAVAVFATATSAVTAALTTTLAAATVVGVVVPTAAAVAVAATTAALALVGRDATVVPAAVAVAVAPAGRLLVAGVRVRRRVLRVGEDDDGLGGRCEDVHAQSATEEGAREVVDERRERLLQADLARRVAHAEAAVERLEGAAPGRRRGGAREDVGADARLQRAHGGLRAERRRRVARRAAAEALEEGAGGARDSGLDEHGDRDGDVQLLRDGVVRRADLVHERRHGEEALAGARVDRPRFVHLLIRAAAEQHLVRVADGVGAAVLEDHQGDLQRDDLQEGDVQLGLLIRRHRRRGVAVEQRDGAVGGVVGELERVDGRPLARAHGAEVQRELADHGAAARVAGGGRGDVLRGGDGGFEAVQHGRDGAGQRALRSRLAREWAPLVAVPSRSIVRVRRPRGGTATAADGGGGCGGRGGLLL